MLHSLLDDVVAFLILLGIGLLFSMRQWPEWARQIRSASWPTIPGTIESGGVSTLRGRSRVREFATASLAYSYQLDGTYYSGYHLENFNDEQKAWSYVDGLKGKTVQVSYNPRRPEVSVLRRQQVPSP